MLSAQAGTDEVRDFAEMVGTELVVIDDTMRSMIHDGAGEHDLERHARTQSPSIRDDGRARVLGGVTSLEELLRVTRED